jgi:hypothetical protein
MSKKICKLLKKSLAFKCDKIPIPVTYVQMTSELQIEILVTQTLKILFLVTQPVKILALAV